MLPDPLKENIKQSFSKVKEDISNLQEELGLQKEILVKQTDILKELKKRFNDLAVEIKSLKDAILDSSNGKSMVNQSFNHLINQSINQSIANQSINQSILDNSSNKGVIGTEEVNHLINQSIINQSLINQSQDSDLSSIKNRIDKTFKSLSKQELKLFLTIYQLEDENLETNYRNIAQKMQLSEHCIRSHISSLMKKNVPILKKRTSNRINLLSINPDFRALNLKQRLINVFYESDPNQTTLFDIN